MVGLATRVGGGTGNRGEAWGTGNREEAWWGLLQGWGGNRDQGGGMVGLATRVGGEQGTGGGMVALLQG